jgi:hypothetical protein
MAGADALCHVSCHSHSLALSCVSTSSRTLAARRYYELRLEGWDLGLSA